MAIFYGNCQAHPLYLLLRATPAFTTAFTPLSAPPAHGMTVRQAHALHQALGNAGVLISHAVKDGYRDMGIGINELAAHLPTSAQLVCTPAVHYDGVFPFQVYIRTGDARESAPVTDYHDLRALHCAAKGWSNDNAREWLRDYEVDPAVLRSISAESVAEMERREHDLSLSFPISHRLTAPDIHDRGFHTINHPTNLLLAEIAQGICRELGIVTQVTTPMTELLGHVRTPIEPQVSDALALTSSSSAWVIGDERVPREDVICAHLDAYRHDPSFIAIGLEQHAERMDALELS